MSFDSYDKSHGRKNKNDDEKYQPINIKTTTLKINIKTNGDFETKEYDLIPFHPNMSDLRDLSNNHFIFFPSFVKITMKDLERAGVGQDFPNVFMNLKKYIQLIKYVTSPEREEDNTLIIDKSQVENYALSIGQNVMKDMMADFVTDLITIKKDEPLTEEEIIINNIGLIKELLFASKSRFFILGNEYIIGESKYLPPYIPEGTNEVLSKNSAGVKIPMDYVVTIQLQLLDAVNNPNAGDFSRMSCKAKKANIAKDSLDIFGTNFGYKEIPRVSTPSILNTSEATKDRKFGKLQKEWEERNKFVKEPTTERERIEMEKKWTPLQRKMADFEKKKGDYSKIPPLWIRERKDLTTKYDTYAEEMIKLWNELNHIKENNKDVRDENNNKYPSFVVDLMDDVENRMKILTQRLIGSEVVEKKIMEEFIHNIVKIKKEDTIEKLLLNNNLIKKKKEEEKTQIDDKYVKPLVETDELDKDIQTLKDKEADIKQQLLTLTSSGDPGDNYNAQALKPELLKIQETLRKKESERASKKQKYGKDEKEIIKNWEKIWGEKEKFLKTIKSDKDKGDKKEKFETLNKELKTKLSDIKKIREDILKAKFFEGEDYELSKRDKKKYEKEDRPIDTLEELESNLQYLTSQYLDTAEKLNKFNKVQAYIKLLNEELHRYKTYKSDIKDEKDKKEREKKPKNDELKTLVQIQEREKDNTKTQEKINNLQKEIEEIQKKINSSTKKMKYADSMIDEYEKHIKLMKKIKESEDSEIIEKIYIKKKEIFEVRIKEMKDKILVRKNGKGEGESEEGESEEGEEGESEDYNEGSIIKGGKKNKGRKTQFVCKTLKYYMKAIKQKNRTKRRIKKYKKIKKNTIKKHKKRGGKRKYTLHRKK